MKPDDFDPEMPEHERQRLESLASRLVADRPVPRAAFRGELRRRVVAGAPPARALRLHVAAYLASGVTLLGVAALGVTDVGPLAPGAPDERESVTQVSHR